MYTVDKEETNGLTEGELFGYAALKAMEDAGEDALAEAEKRAAEGLLRGAFIHFHGMILSGLKIFYKNIEKCIDLFLYLCIIVLLFKSILLFL